MSVRHDNMRVTNPNARGMYGFGNYDREAELDFISGCDYSGFGYAGMGSFLSQLESIADTVFSAISKFGPIIAAAASVIPVVGPAISAGVAAVTAAAKMYRKYKMGKDVGAFEGTYDGIGSVGGWKERYEADMKKLIMMNHYRKKQGKKIWKGTWDEYRAHQKKEHDKLMADVKRKAFQKKVKLAKDNVLSAAKAALNQTTPEKLLETYAIPRRRKYGERRGSKYYEAGTVQDVSYKGKRYPLKRDRYSNLSLWRKIHKSRAAKQMRKTFTEPVMPTVSDVKKKGWGPASRAYGDIVWEMMHDYWDWARKQYALQEMNMNRPPYNSMTLPQIEEIYLAWAINRDPEEVFQEFVKEGGRLQILSPGLLMSLRSKGKGKKKKSGGPPVMMMSRRKKAPPKKKKKSTPRMVSFF